MKREQLSTDITRIQFDSMEEWLASAVPMPLLSLD